jgi:muramoyltetrapeptide carboxypeptidase
MPTLLPKGLSRGDTLGVFSPSVPATQFAPLRSARAHLFLQKNGFRVRKGTLYGKTDGYRSGTIEERANELNEFLRDPTVRCIMSAIGGSNSNSLLPYLDYEAFRKDPKVIVGYSDATAILLALYAKTGIPVFYGPAFVASFGEFPPFVEETYAHFHSMTQAGASHPKPLSFPTEWTDEMIPWEEQDTAKVGRKNSVEFQGSGTFSGRLMGGNLHTLGGIWGSPYMPEIKEGDILLIEDSLKTIATVERGFAFLRANGVFDRVQGVLLGKHELFDDQGTGREPVDVLREVLNGRDMPIVKDFDCCHTHPMLTLPIGADIQVNFDAEEVTVLGPWLQGQVAV